MSQPAMSDRDAKIASEQAREARLDEQYRLALENLHAYLRRSDLGFFEAMRGTKERVRIAPFT